MNPTPILRFVLPETDATGLLRNRGIREWHAWRFSALSPGVWTDAGQASGFGSSLILQAVEVDEISTRRRYIVTTTTARTSSPVLIRTQIFDCGRKLRVNPNDPGLVWEVGLRVPRSARIADSGPAGRVFVPVAGLRLEEAPKTEAIIRQRDVESRFLAVTFKPDAMRANGGVAYGKARLVSPTSIAGNAGAGIYRRTTDGVSPHEFRYGRSGYPRFSMTVATSGVGTTCTVSEQTDAGLFKPRARLYGPGTLVSVAAFGRGVWGRQWAGRVPGQPRCTMELVRESEAMLLRNPGRSELAGVFGLGTGCFCGLRRPLTALRSASQLMESGDGSEWLLVPRAAVSAATVLLAMLGQHGLPHELALLTAGFVQFQWWDFGKGRGSRSESTVLTTQDQAAIRAAVPRGIDPVVLLKSAELESVELLTLAIW